METVLLIMSIIAVVTSNVYWYRKGKRVGYGDGAIKVLDEWKKYMGTMGDI